MVKRRNIGRRRGSTLWLPWVVAGIIVLLVGLLVARVVMAPSLPAEAAGQEWFQGIGGQPFHAGETSYLYPHPAYTAEEIVARADALQRRWLPALGQLTAPVTIVEFSDLYCGHCRNFNLNNLEGILEEYVATGQVRYVDHFYGFPRTVQEGYVHAMMCAAEQGRYFAFKHALFEAQESGVANIAQSAREAGLDMGQFNTCQREDRYTEAVAEIVDAAAQQGVSATPTFFVNGEMVQGNDPEGIRRLVENALAAGE